MSIDGPDLDRRLGARVRALRMAGGLTLDTLAGRSGVSRAMLSRVERGASSPTAQLLARIGAGLGVSLGVLVSGPADEPDPLRRRDDQPVWRDPATGYRRRSVVPAARAGLLDLAEITVPPGASVGFASGPPAGAVQHVWLLDGLLSVEGAGEAVALAPGDCLLMRDRGPVAFRNPGPEPARYALFLTPGAARP